MARNSTKTIEERKTNKYGINQYTAPDPRQTVFLKAYIDPKSKTFSNAYESAIYAGYTEEYAKVILSKDLTWLSESVKTNMLLEKAEKRLIQYLDFEPVNEEGKIDHQLMTNQMKAMTLVLKGIGKDKYSERQEHTGKDGEKLFNDTRELSTEELLKLANDNK